MYTRYAQVISSVFLFLSLFVFGGQGCVGTQPKSDPHSKKVTVSLRGLSCQSCGQRVVRVLRMKKGIKKAAFNRKKVELTVVYDPRKANSDLVLKSVKELGFTGIIGEGKGAYKTHVEFGKGMDVTWPSKKGEDAKLKDHLAPGKVTVFDFYADWCGPCRDVDREMHRLLTEHKDIALRKLNIVDWEQPIAKRYLVGVRALPYVIVYSPKGKLVRKISGLKLKELNAAIHEARKQ